MFDAQIDVDGAKADLHKFFEDLHKQTLEAIKETVGNIQKLMQEPGAPIRYPVQWDSEKQRRFVMAKLKRENNLPYRRTGQYNAAWQIQPIENGFELGNRSGRALFLAGTASGADMSLGKKQSNIHRGRWRLFRPTVDEEVAKLPQNIIDRIRITEGE